MKKTIRMLKREDMNKILPKMLTFIFVAALIITSTVNVARSLQADELSGNVNELGIDTSVMYNSDNTSATVSVDMLNVDMEKYEIKQVLGFNGEVLDLNSLSTNVSANGDYLLKVQYIDKTTVVEVPEATKVPEANSEIIEPTQVTIVEPEVREIELATNINRIVEAEGYVQEENNSEANSEATPVEQTPMLASGSSRVGAEITDITQIFGPLSILGTNTGASISGNKIVAFDTTDSTVWPFYGENANSISAGVGSKEKINNRTNWTLKGKGGISVSDAIYAKYSTGYIHPEGGDKTAFGVSIGGLNFNVNLSKFFSAYGVSAGLSGLVIANTTAQAYEKPGSAKVSSQKPEFGDFELRHVWDGKNSTYTFSYAGQTVTRVDANNQWGGNTGTLSMSGRSLTNKNRAKDVGVGAELEFISFSYDNFNPVIESTNWYKDGVALDEKSNVNVGDVLDVEMQVKNDSAATDSFDTLILASDDPAKAVTKGVTMNDPAMNSDGTGMPVTITNESQTVKFKVRVADGIGKISLGMRMEDTFFHEKFYSQVDAKISIGEILEDLTPTYTIMEYNRDASGAIIVDGTGKPTYVNAANQNMLTQDSFVKVAGTLVNPRTAESLTAVMKMDLTKAPGFDYGNMTDLKLVNGSGTDLVNGLTFPLAANGGKGTFEYIVPVKQDAIGAPFNSGEQVINYNIDGTFNHAIDGLVTGNWVQTDVVSNTTVKPITDVNVSLTTTKLALQRAQVFDLRQTTNPLLVFTGTNGVSADLETIAFANQGSTDDWKKFGLDSATDGAGTVDNFAEDGTTMQSQVVYNQVILINGKKHYTRMGLGPNVGPRSKTGMITLEVNGGIINPEAYFEIPERVQLTDQGGIDNTYLGAKATIGIKDAASSTNLEFDITGDTNFKINDGKKDFYLVSLFNDDASEMPKTGDIATVGKFDKNNLKKVVWFNAKKDSNKASSKYEGAMTFYITSK